MDVSRSSLRLTGRWTRVFLNNYKDFTSPFRETFSGYTVFLFPPVINCQSWSRVLEVSEVVGWVSTSFISWDPSSSHLTGGPTRRCPGTGTTPADRPTPGDPSTVHLYVLGMTLKNLSLVFRPKSTFYPKELNRWLDLLKFVKCLVCLYKSPDSGRLSGITNFTFRVF